MEAPGPERRLAAVLAADMVGYSRLMEVDEAGTLARLKTHRLELIDPSIAKNRGRIIKTTGDGMLVEFHSVVDAVTCAAEVQRRMARRNADVSPARWIQFRIGINLGDVIIEDNDIFGDGVNVAARLEVLAEPGGICVSGAVRDQVSHRLDDIAFEDIGEQNVKNITRPIHVFRVRLEPDAAAAPVSGKDGAAATITTRKPSIAVLPLVNMSGDPEQEFFADGLTEDIITELSRFRDLLVISRNSTFVHKGKAVKVQEVARELGVEYVLEGSVRKVGDRVRVTVQLIDAQTDRHVWAERYDRKLEDIFAIQDEVTGAIVARFPAASKPPRRNARSASEPTTWPPMSACSPPRCCTTARSGRPTPRRRPCSTAPSRSIRITRTRMPGRPACWARPGSMDGARIATPPFSRWPTSCRSRWRSMTMTATCTASWPR